MDFFTSNFKVLELNPFPTTVYHKDTNCNYFAFNQENAKENTINTMNPQKD